jgi:beta-lactamase regulating signal transducer with metallopeptidase domain
MKHFVRTEQRKAQCYFVLIVFVNIVVLSSIATGIGIGIKGYIFDTKSTYESITCCGSICSKCFFNLRTVTTIIPWACMTIFLIGIYKAFYKIFFLLRYNYNFTRFHTSLSLENYPNLKYILHSAQINNQVTLLKNSEPHYAFTLGLWKPKIYLSSGICSYLTRKELLAVILHEEHHKKNKDPLKLFLIQIFHALNFFLPINHNLLNQFSSASEKAADDSAINLSREPLELASALVKMCKSHNTTKQQSLLPSFKGQNIVEDRVKRLLMPEVSVPDFRNTYWCLPGFLSFLIAATICASLFYNPRIHAGECKTRICHMNICG